MARWMKSVYLGDFQVLPRPEINEKKHKQWRSVWGNGFPETPEKILQ